MKKTILFYTNSDDNGYTNNAFKYLLDFQPSLGYMILTPTDLYVIVDSRYFDNLYKINLKKVQKRLGHKTRVHHILLDKKIESLIGEYTTYKTLCVEDSVPLNFHEKIKNIRKIQIIPPYFEEKRILKQPDEVKNIEHAIKIIKKVFTHIKKLNKKGELYGKTEMTVRRIIIDQIFKNGGTGEGFESIVAFGKNSAIPHHETGETIIQEGVLLLDMGALYNGYTSDFSRTIWVEKKRKIFQKNKKASSLKQEFEAVKKIVKKAQSLAIAGIKKGKKLSELDDIARDYIEQKGYGVNFTHSTGHGVGLNIHERPWVSPKKGNDIIIKGMAFTIEPGIYLTNKFGVRIEDILIIK